MSTFVTNSEEAKMLLSEYVSCSYPEAAKEEGIHYWDMSTWFGAYNPELMADDYHYNAAGGAKIADELYTKITGKGIGEKGV